MKTKKVYFLLDCSGSMYGARADALNEAMRAIAEEATNEIRSQETPDLKLSFIAIGFSGAGVFEIMPETDLEDFTSWTPIEGGSFDGGTPTGAAIQAVIDDIQGTNHGAISKDVLPPLIILVSDGEPNGSDPTYEEVMECAVKESPKNVDSFRRALRIAIGVNVSDEGRASLEKFGNLSRTMRESQLQAYYDCTDDHINDLVTILKSVTINATANKK